MIYFVVRTPGPRFPKQVPRIHCVDRVGGYGGGERATGPGGSTLKQEWMYPKNKSGM